MLDGLQINRNPLKTTDKLHRMMYGFCGASWLSAIPFFCAGLKAGVGTSVLGGFDLDVGRVIYASGSLNSQF